MPSRLSCALAAVIMFAAPAAAYAAEFETRIKDRAIETPFKILGIATGMTREEAMEIAAEKGLSLEPLRSTLSMSGNGKTLAYEFDSSLLTIGAETNHYSNQSITEMEYLSVKLTSPASGSVVSQVSRVLRRPTSDDSISFEGIAKQIAETLGAEPAIDQSPTGPRAVWVSGPDGSLLGNAECGEAIYLHHKYLEESKRVDEVACTATYTLSESIDRSWQHRTITFSINDQQRIADDNAELSSQVDKHLFEEADATDIDL